VPAVEPLVRRLDRIDRNESPILGPLGDLLGESVRSLDVLLGDAGHGHGPAPAARREDASDPNAVDELRIHNM
jgi:hypothetical protein